MNRKRTVAAVLLILSVFSFFIPSFQLPYIDSKSSEYLNDTLKKLTITYATVRGLNAAVSVIKDSEMEIAPGGVGATIAVGEVVDPIDDLIERFSSILLISIASVGIQKAVFLAGTNLFFKLIGVFLFLLSLFFIFKKQWLFNLGIKIVAVAVLLRVMVPVSAFLTDYTYTAFFKESVEKAQSDISEIVEILKTDNNNSSSFIGKIKGFNVEEKVSLLKSYSSRLIDGIIVMLTAFIFQTVLLPLFAVWVMLKSVERIFSYF
ncbi:MAG: hypothetical protein Q9M89_04505 [Persephonella sp.]|nr:hypothetical protein [Persephonella sp.]